LDINIKHMTRNDCYTTDRIIKPVGIMVHSTATPGVMAGDWFSRWNKSYKAKEINRQVCVHAFLDDKEVWQYLPWNHRGWHAGGDANNNHIGFEICEPGGFSYLGSKMIGYDPKKHEDYFRKAFNNAVELSAYLCKMYGLTERDILCHSEGARLGIASSHADVMHWFPKHGETMDTFRAAVKEKLRSESKKVFKVGDVVSFKSTAVKYHPGGPDIPSWVKQLHHRITQTDSNGIPVKHMEKECVLLGRRIDINTKEESSGINTWVDKDHLILIEETKPSAEKDKKLYCVQVGAFSKEENAEELMKKLSKAGFKSFLKLE